MAKKKEERDDRRPGVPTYKIPLRQIVENHNPRYPFSESMRKAGWTVFGHAPPPGSTHPTLWEMATSDETPLRAEYCKILEELDPQMVSEATTLITIGQMVAIELRDNGAKGDRPNTYTVVDGMRRVMMGLYNWCKTGLPKEPWLEARLSPKVNEVGLYHRSIVGNRRKEPNAMEKARAIQHCLNLGQDLVEIAATYGQSEQTMQRSLDLLALPIEVQRKIEAGTLKPTKALADANGESNGHTPRSKKIGAKEWEHRTGTLVGVCEKMLQWAKDNDRGREGSALLEILSEMSWAVKQASKGPGGGEA